MMPPVVGPSPSRVTTMEGLSDALMDHEPVASEAEGDDLIIDVEGVHHGFSASAPFRHRTTSPNSMVQPLAGVVLGSMAALLPGKKYHCQRCLNHGLEIPRKGHKRECRYTDCQCDDCKLVEKRKILNREINSERERLNESPASPNMVGGSDKDGENSLNKVRNPRCARCRAHDPEKEPPPLKGHKKACRYKNCECKKCSLITCRRDVMAKQIRLRRKQKSKPIDISSSTSNSAQSPLAPSTNDQAGKSTLTNQYLSNLKSHPANQKFCVDLITPPITDAGSQISLDNGDSAADNFDHPMGAAAVRPQPTYPLPLAPHQPPMEQCCATNSPMSGINPFNGHFQFPLPLVSAQPPTTAPAPAASALAALCPQQLFAGFLHYIQSIANAVSTNSPGTNTANHGLTLPTMPAAIADHSAHGGANPAVPANQAAVAAALAVLQRQARAAAAVAHPSAPDICIIPYCLSSTGSTNPLPPSFHPAAAAAAAAHQQQCILNDHHQRLAALASSFGQGQHASLPSHFFPLQ